MREIDHHSHKFSKNKFQNSFLQLYLKNLIFAGKQAAHIWRKLEDKPNVLLPMMSNAGTIKPIIVPATYQGQGAFKFSIISNIFVF